MGFLIQIVATYRRNWAPQAGEILMESHVFVYSQSLRGPHSRVAASWMDCLKLVRRCQLLQPAVVCCRSRLFCLLIYCTINSSDCPAWDEDAMA